MLLGCTVKADLGFPELQEAIFTVGGNQILVRVVCDSNHILLMNRQRSLQLASDCAEAVEHKVLPNTVDPLATRGQGTANKVTTLSFTRTEASDDLALHVHDDHCVRSVTHNEVLWVFRKQNHTVDCNICPCSTAQGLKGI